MSEVKLTDPVADQLRERFPSNSINKQKIQPLPPREKVQPIVKGKVSLQKETFGMRMKKMFFPGDIRDIKRYALEQILIPSVKNGALSLMELMLFNTISRRSINGPINNNQKTNYTYVSSGGTSTVAQSAIQKTNSFNFQNIVFENYRDAEDIITTLLDLLGRYGSVRVADFYDLAHIDSDYAAENWGWKSFQRLETRAVQGGYVIDISQPVPLK